MARERQRSWIRLTVVVPTHNSAGSLAQCLAALQPGFDGFMMELVVADGGSTDSTRDIARRYKADVLDSGGPIGQRLEEAALLKEGDWLLFLRPETILSRGWVDAARDFTESGENYRIAGYFQPKLAEASGRARRLEGLLGMRGKWFGRPAAEQGLLMGRSFYDELRGFRHKWGDPHLDMLSRVGWASLKEIPCEAMMAGDCRYLGPGASWRFWSDFFSGMVGR
jgi:glycosyltransferase involved in cell wall biosynthesis